MTPLAWLRSLFTPPDGKYDQKLLARAASGTPGCRKSQREKQLLTHWELWRVYYGKTVIPLPLVSRQAGRGR